MDNWINKLLRHPILVFVLITACFALAYTQSPLYTSNQNQYFLHGYAEAGVGFLNQDWLANTDDPTPVFSTIVEVTYRYLRLEVLFYIYYALLMGVYLFSLMGIMLNTFDFGGSPVGPLLYLTLLISAHSAGIRFAFSRIIGENWTFILEDGVADQRLLGLVFQPSTFGVLLVLSIYLFIRQKPLWAVVAAVLAATVHPTYLLSAALLTLTYMLVTFKEERQIFKSLRIGLAAFILILPILAYVIFKFTSTIPETTARAHEILVNFRIPHHALISWWFDSTAVVKILLIILALIIIRKRRLFLIVLVPLIIAVILSGIQLLTQSNELALIFPWRPSTFLVPLSTAILLAYGVTEFVKAYPTFIIRYQNWIYGLSIGLIGFAMVIGGIRLGVDFGRMASQNANAMMAYVNRNQESGETYLIPIKMQDFRLETGSPIYVDFKSIPYKDSDVIEWYRRIQLAKRFYKESDCEALSELVQDRAITHVVIENKIEEQCSLENKIYQDSFYSIYNLNSP